MGSVCSSDLGLNPGSPAAPGAPWSCGPSPALWGWGHPFPQTDSRQACLSVPRQKLVGPRLTRKLSFNVRSLFCSMCCHRLVTKSCPTLCDPMDCSPPGSSVHGILQAGTLERVAISSSRGSSWPGSEPRSPALAGVFLSAETLLT